MSDEYRPEMVISNTTDHTLDENCTMYEGFFPQIVVCPTTRDMTEPPNRNPPPFEIGDQIVEHIRIPDCPLTIELYKIRKIKLKEPIRKVTFVTKKISHYTRHVQLAIKFVGKKFDTYMMSITLPNI